MHRKYLEQLA